MFKKVGLVMAVGFMAITASVFAGGTFENSGVCPADLQMTQNLKAPKAGEGYVRNGKYHWYTKGTVREAHILQKHLNRLGFNAGKVDGIIGPNTKGAILRLQKYLGTKQDGYVGPKTRKLLNNSCGAVMEGNIFIIGKDLEKISIDLSAASLDFENSGVYYGFENDDWEKKYSAEDIELSRKAYTDDYAYSDYMAGNFSVDAKINIKDKKTREFADMELSMSADAAVNIPELELDFDAKLSYNIDTNQKDAIYEFKQIANEFNIDYKDFMQGDLKISAVVKDLDVYVNIDDIPNFYWDAFEKGLKDGLGENNELSSSDIMRKVKKYEGDWIKIEIPEKEKKFVEAMVKSVIPELKKQALSQAKIYRERPFIIIDKSSKSRSGKYYSYDATFDLKNLVYMTEKIFEQDDFAISNSDMNEIIELMEEGEEVIKDIKFKVYLDKRTDELRKISSIVNLDLGEFEKDVEAEIFLNLKSETSHISNTVKNNISAPRNSIKWEKIFEDIVGKSYEEYQEDQMEKINNRGVGVLGDVSGKDRKTKTFMKTLIEKAAAEFFYKKSYKNSCQVLKDEVDGKVSDFNCNNTTYSYAAEVRLDNGKYFCIDSKWNSLELDKSILKNTSCLKVAKKIFSNIDAVSDNDYILGNKNADIFVIEYSDLEGPFSKKFHNESFKKLKDKYKNNSKVAMVYRPFPLTSLHPYSFGAAVSGECVYREEGTRDFFKFLEKNYSGDVKKHKEYAEDFISENDLSRCINNGRASDKINGKFNAAVKNGIKGIPSIFIQDNDGQRFIVSPYFESIDEEIEKLLN